MAIQNYPILNLGLGYVNGLIVSNDATTPNTKLDISAGQCRDSNNIMDLTVGATNLNLEGGSVTAPLVINAAVVGANGLDTGSLAASTVYAVYVIGDSRYYNQCAGLLSLASSSSPTMPFGYDSYRLIGYAVTDAAVHFLAMYISGNGNARVFSYDAAQAFLSGGNQTSATAVSLVTLVPPVANTPIWIYSDFTPNAANSALIFRGYNQTGNIINILAPVAGATAHTHAQSYLLAQLNGTAPSVKYLVGNGADAVTAYVTGFEFYV